MVKRISIILISIAFLVAAALKAPSTDAGVPNLEATYHVLLTDTALLANPVSDHHLLPTATLGSPRDKFVPWAAAIPLASGHYIYTSFPSGGFLAPYSYFKLTGQAPDRAALFQFTLLLHLAVVAALMALLVRLLQALDVPAARVWPAAAASTLVQIFSCQAMLDYGAIYWAQQLYQLVLILSLVCALEIIRRDGRQAGGWTISFALLAFIGPWIEWTAVVFAGGAAVLFAYWGWSRAQYRLPAFATAGALLLGVVSMMAHYAVHAGLADTLTAMMSRAVARSGTQWGMFSLVRGYATSYGLLLLVPVVALVGAWRHRRRLPEPLVRVGLPLLMLAVIPLLENALLLQHATEFAFDRLKLIIPLAMIVAYGLSRIERYRWLAVALLALALAQNVGTYYWKLAKRSDWAGIEASNARLAGDVARRIDLSCALLGTNVPVRGYTNLLFMRAIHELIAIDDFERIAARTPHDHCGLVYLEGEGSAVVDLPRFTRARIWREGRWSEVAAR